MSQLSLFNKWLQVTFRSVFAKKAASCSITCSVSITPSLFNWALLEVWPQNCAGCAGGGLQFSFLRSTGLYGARWDQSRPVEAFERERSEVWPRRFAARQWRWAERTASACLRSPDSSTWTRLDSQRDRGRDEQWDTEHVCHRARHTCICLCTTVVMSVTDTAKVGPRGSTRLDWMQSFIFCKSKVMSPWDKISAPELPGKCFCFCFSFPSMCVNDWFRFLGSSVIPVKHYFCNVILLIKLQMS